MSQPVENQSPISAPDLQPGRNLLRKTAQELLFDRDMAEVALSGLKLTRKPHDILRDPAVLRPSVTLIVQGCRSLTLGCTGYEVAEYGFAINALPLPVMSDITIHGDSTYMAMELPLDLALVERMRREVPGRISCPVVCSVATGSSPEWMIDCITRMLLLPLREGIGSVIAGVLQQELILRLRGTPFGRGLHELTVAGSPMERVHRAAGYIADRFRQPLVVADLASHCDWSTSSFHHHFRRLTTMTPLRYQQFLRLSEARRILSTTQSHAGEVALQVGYTSPSQFNREYRRLFGAPPIESVSVL
ncbi:AraC-type DNA-binding protein [Rhizobium sp. NFR07]|uniref:helix-turn-helix domain-containing protein n=1 Tax=Rhizobium sp. NFR07 TaxID=1566262 RepID=UPI0008E54F79|nr:helix-turn-helix domain-containing protein [Rhizobium sp. NFR07]SFA75242.1 AraC-type DNA-binding protein [Rhizobium sp. NFR07]